MDATDALDRLDRERALLADALSLRWFHWAIVALSLATTVLGWRLALGVVEAKEARRFEHEAVTTTDALGWRLERRLEALDAAGDAEGRAVATDVAAVAGLMRGILAPGRRLVGLAVSRDGETLYEDAPSSRPRAPRRRLERTLPVDGGAWTVEAWSTPELERRSRRHLPQAVLVGGLLAEALLLGLFLVQARGARRTLALAEEVAELWTRLRAKAAELERANGELEGFACVASHDLKAPLVGAGLLLRSVLEDLEEAGPDAVSDAASVLARLHRLDARLDRMQGLIDGVLAWGAVGERGAGPERVDVAALVRRIGEELGVGDARLRPASTLPVLTTDRLRLEQVLANLVGNAFKYHPDPARATVEVSAEREGTMVRFHVDDDGAGVPEADRERVFAMFDTGGGASRPDATGLGLAIVAKSVELAGGRVGVRESPTGGARFSFTWPASAGELAGVADAAAPPTDAAGHGASRRRAA